MLELGVLGVLPADCSSTSKLCDADVVGGGMVSGAPVKEMDANLPLIFSYLFGGSILLEFNEFHVVSRC